MAAWRGNDKFTPAYILLFLPVGLIQWVWWLLPNWNWWQIDLFLSFIFLPAAIIFLIVNVVRLRWKGVASLLLSGFLVLHSWYYLSPLGITPDSVRFALTKQSYIQEIDQIGVSTDTPRLKAFAWDATFIGKSYKTLVYDESDEIALPLGTQSAAWMKRRNESCVGQKPCIPFQSQPPDELVTVQKLADHFYIVDDFFPDAFP